MEAMDEVAGIDAASSRQPGLTRLSASEPTPSIGVSFDGWMLPKAGVAFVWVLQREMASAKASSAHVPRWKTCRVDAPRQHYALRHGSSHERRYPPLRVLAGRFHWNGR
jgi:hypothetical protein